MMTHTPHKARAGNVSRLKAAPHRASAVLMCALALLACEPQQAPVMAEPEEAPLLAQPVALGKADGPTRASLPAGFPSEQDLAILLPMDAEPPLKPGLSTKDGGVLLSESWVNTVSDAYLDTDVMDALERENWYEEWQVVSIRIAPCGPLGHYPGHTPEGACWPQVRVVWQPVLEDYMLFGFTQVDRYGDDRAIHALYRVAPGADARENAPAFEAVRDQINQGGALEDLDRALLDDFARERNLAMMRLTADVAALREVNQGADLWRTLDVREEYLMSGEAPYQFQDRLRDFLAAYAQPWALHELTSFSLPEGRNPAHVDSWVFLAFEGHGGDIIQKDITVQSRETGEVLVNMGSDQTVATTGEDEAVIEAMADPSRSEELAQHVFMENSDADIFGDVIADPTQTFVSNTTCATCHRLTDNPFDFHTFSYLEDRAATISPRVVEDVDNDLRVLRAFLETWPE